MSWIFIHVDTFWIFINMNRTQSLSTEYVLNYLFMLIRFGYLSTRIELQILSTEYVLDIYSC
jgi:hypothetical protein